MCLFNLRETIEPGYCFAQGQSLKSLPPSQKGKWWERGGSEHATRRVVVPSRVPCLWMSFFALQQQPERTNHIFLHPQASTATSRMTDNNPASTSSTRTMLIPTGTPNKQVIVTRQVRQRKSAGATKAMVVEDAAEPTPATVARAQRMSRDQVQSAMLSSSKALRGVVDIVATQTASKVRQLCNSRLPPLCAKVEGC